MDIEKPVFARRFVQLQARCKGKKGKRTRRSRSIEKRRKKFIPKGKDPKVPVRQEGQTSQYPIIFKRSYAKGNPHSLIGPECSHYKPKKWMHMGKYAYIQAHKKTWRSVGMQSLPHILKKHIELDCVLQDGQRDTFSARSIWKKIGWPPTKKQFRVRYCRNAEWHFRKRKKRAPAGCYSVESNECSQSERSSGLSTAKKNLDWQHGVCTQHVHKIRGTCRENKDTFFEKEDCDKSCLPHEESS